jgi:hypothetical protein
VLLPGYQVINNGSNNSTNNGTIDTNATEFIPLPTEFCSFGTYSDGTTLGCKPCPYGATTLRNASISADECVVPPGYFVRDSATGGEMVQCLTTPANAETEGYYRPGWKAYKEVGAAAAAAPAVACLVLLLAGAAAFRRHDARFR